jgi:ABC-type nitrate/sulfonate/bicarbonate transport system substrate-binding protein
MDILGKSPRELSMNLRPSMWLRLFAASALLFSAAQAESNPPTNAAAPELKTLSVMATTDVQIGGPWIVAREKGLFAQEGFTKIDLKLFSAAPAAFPAFTSGDLQVMNHGEQPMLTLVAADIPLKVVGFYSDMTGLHGMLANGKIMTAKDLEGKNVGVQKGSPMEWYTRNFCKVFGCDISKVNLLNMPAPEGVSALVNGSIDAYAGWQPYIGRVLEAGKDKGIHLLHYNNTSRMPGSEGPKKIHSAITVIYVSRGFLEKNPRTVEALLRVLDRSIHFIHINRAEAAAILASEFKISDAVAAEQLDAVKYRLSIDEGTVKDIQATADLLFNEKLIKKPVDFVKTALDTEPLRRVDPNAVTYGH